MMQLVSLMTAKSFVCVSSIFVATRFAAIIYISKFDVVIKGKMLWSILKQFSPAYLDAAFGRHYKCVNRQLTIKLFLQEF